MKLKMPVRVRRATVQLALSIAGMATISAAAFTISTLAGLALAGLACFALERRIAK